MSAISIPTTARLRDSLRLESTHPVVLKLVRTLSRNSLLALAVKWLDESDASLVRPFLLADAEVDENYDIDSDFYPPHESRAELREFYVSLQAGPKFTKKELIDRILDGDWRKGLTLHQLAGADLQHLQDQPLSQRWSAYRIVPLRLRPTEGERRRRGGGGGGEEEEEEDVPPEVDRESLLVPRFHPSTFINNLHAQLPPDVKAHFALERHPQLPVLILRIFILDTPYCTALVGSDVGGLDASSRTVYVAFPDASPHLYLSNVTAQQAAGVGARGGGGGGPRNTAGETRSLRALVLEGIPKALSRPRERYALEPTSLSTRNLAGAMERRGGQRTNGAGGGWAIYADKRKKESPLDTGLPTPPLSEGEGEDLADRGAAGQQGNGQQPAKRKATVEEKLAQSAAKRRRLVARSRFGDSARMDDGKGVERVDIAMQDPYPSPPPPPSLANGSRAGEDEDDAEESGPEPQPARATVAIGRRSTLDAAFAREAEGREGREGGPAALLDDDDDDDAGGRGGWRPGIRLTFHGPHVFAGIRQLVEVGVIDGERMPGWMTGEEGVTIGAVKDGRIRGHKGSGL